MANAKKKTAVAAAVPDCYSNESAYHHTLAGLHFPAPDSVAGRFLGSMLRGESIGTLDALYRFHTTAATQIAQHLRERCGWPVVSTLHEVRTRDAGRTSRVARYSLSPETIAVTGEIGREFAAAALIAEHERKRGAA